MLWVKTLHIVFMVTWFAGLFYLPRLFVYHAQSSDQLSIERFKVMERKLYYGIMAPGAVLTIAFGVWLWLGYGVTGGWMHAKLLLVAVLVGAMEVSRSSPAMTGSRHCKAHCWTPRSSTRRPMADREPTR